MLDPDLMPYDQINVSAFPVHDPAVAMSAPRPDTPNYGGAMLQYIQSVAPEEVQGLPVRFFSTLHTHRAGRRSGGRSGAGELGALGLPHQPADA
jgi:hypothetical protein